jgi:hypothetical protein
MADKAPLSTFVTSPEGEERVRAYKEAQENLRQALDSRQNQLFDPTLLAISQALGSPTKTGSFGEVLGNVAGAVGTAQEAEQKRSREIANMRLELAKQGLQSYQGEQGEKAFRSLIDKMTGAAPQATPGAPAAAPGAPGAPAAAPGGLPGAAPKPPGMSISQEDLLKLSTIPGYEDKAKTLQSIAEFGRKGIISTPDGPFNLDTLQYVNIDKPNEEQKPVVTPYGTYPLFPSQVRKFREMEEKGQGQEYLDSILKPKSKPAGAQAPGIKTTSQSEVEATEAKVGAEARAKSDAARYEDFLNKGVSAGPRIARLGSIEQIASRPDAKQIFGVFEGPELSAALGKIVEPSITNIRDAFTNVGLDKKLKADQLFAAQQIALVNLEMRKIMRSPGEGAQSDMENRMALGAGLADTDTPAGMVKKIRFLKAQAEFERDVMREMEKSGTSAKKFILSDRYGDLLTGYERKLGQVLGVAPAKAKPAASSGNYGPASQQLRKELGME